jgi:hypothetical protein
MRGGIAAPLFSAVGMILHGRRLEKKAQKAHVAMSFLLFTLISSKKMLKISINFSWISP